MRIVFVGTVEGSAIALKALNESGIKPELIITLPPEAASRHSDFVDLKKIAGASPVFATRNINETATLNAVKSVDADVCLVVGWSQICKSAFRELASIGCVGFHPSPLPRFRGRAVVPWTILQEEKSSASTLFWLDEGVDSGDILLQRHFDISPSETARSLYDKHLVNMSQMVPEAVRLIASGAPPRLPQDHSKATYCAKRRREDGIIDWRQPADAILRLIRAVGDPYPGAFTYFNGEVFTIDEAMPHQRSGQFVGLAGQVQALEDGLPVVRCGDGNCIVIERWRSASGGAPPLHGKFPIVVPGPKSG